MTLNITILSTNQFSLHGILLTGCTLVGFTNHFGCDVFDSIQISDGSCNLCFSCQSSTTIVSSEESVIILAIDKTGTGSAVAAIQFLKDEGVRHIKFMCIIAAPEGVKAVQETHPDVDVFAAALDDHLNEHGYIVPGLGDAGDRIFGTK